MKEGDYYESSSYEDYLRAFEHASSNSSERRLRDWEGARVEERRAAAPNMLLEDWRAGVVAKGSGRQSEMSGYEGEMRPPPPESASISPRPARAAKKMSGCRRWFLIQDNLPEHKRKRYDGEFSPDGEFESHPFPEPFISWARTPPKNKYNLIDQLLCRITKEHLLIGLPSDAPQPDDDLVRYMMLECSIARLSKWHRWLFRDLEEGQTYWGKTEKEFERHGHFRHRRGRSRPPGLDPRRGYSKSPPVPERSGPLSHGQLTSRGMLWVSQGELSPSERRPLTAAERQRKSRAGGKLHSLAWRDILNARKKAANKLKKPEARRNRLRRGKAPESPEEPPKT
jgi:hypothetical protein